MKSSCHAHRPRAAAIAVALACGVWASAALAAPNLLVNGSFEARAVTATDTCLGSAWCVRSFASTPGWTQFADGVA